jgi:hypothetical protein
MGQSKSPDFFSQLFSSGDLNPAPAPTFREALAKAPYKAEATPDNFLSSLYATKPTPQPTPQLNPKGIRFYRHGGDIVRFTEPRRFSWTIPQIAWAGLYVILVADNSWRPRFFRAIYFGEAENLAVRPTTNHERCEDWCKAASGVGNLYVAYHFMMRASKADRTAIESGLIGYYAPECNKVYNLFADS